MDQFLLEFGIDKTIVLLVIAGGFFATTYLKTWTWASDAWKTLIVGSIFSAAYIFVVFQEKEITAATWKTFLVSYVFSTSFYELALKWIILKVKQLFPANQ
jgi:hypothetical protein